jgi:hypothetical protein
MPTATPISTDGLSEAEAIAFVEAYTGWKITTTTFTEDYVPHLPDWLAWAPLASAPTIIDLEDNETLAADDDFLWTDEAQIIELHRYPYEGIWQIEYTAGWGSLDDAPDWATTVVDEITGLEIDLGIFEEQALGDYKYKVGRAEELEKNYPNIMTILNLHVRSIV